MDDIAFASGLGTLTASGAVGGRAFTFGATLPGPGATARGVIAGAASAVASPARLDIGATLAPAPGHAAEPVPPGALLSCLAEGPAWAREAARALAASLGHREAIGALGDCHWDASHVEFYSGWTARASRRRAIAAEAPSLRILLPGLLPVAPGIQPDATDVDPVAALMSVLVRRYPGAPATAGALAAAMGAGIAFSSVDEVAALACNPGTRIPASVSERRAFADLAWATADLSARMGGCGFLALPRGDWEGLAETVSASLPPEGPGRTFRGLLRGRCAEAIGMADAFVEQALLPALLRHLPDTADHMRRNEGAVRRCGSGLLFDGKGLVEILGDLASWKARRSSIDDALSSMGWWRGRRWGVPFQPMTAPNGIELAFVGDDAALATDIQGALDVGDGGDGTLADRAASGTCAIVSLRRASGDSVARLSAAEVVVGPADVEVVRHRGPRDWDPPGGAQRALEWLVEEVRSGRAMPDPDYLRNRGTWDLANACRVDPHADGIAASAVSAWAPSLPPSLREPGALAGSARVRACLAGIDGAPTGDATREASPGPGPVRDATAVQRRARGLMRLIIPGDRGEGRLDVADAVVVAYGAIALTWFPAVVWMARVRALTPGGAGAGIPEEISDASLPAAALALWPRAWSLVPAAMVAAIACSATGLAVYLGARFMEFGRDGSLALLAWMAAGVAYYASAAGVANQVALAWRARGVATGLREAVSRARDGEARGKDGNGR